MLAKLLGIPRFAGLAFLTPLFKFLFADMSGWVQSSSLPRPTHVAQWSTPPYPSKVQVGPSVSIELLGKKTTPKSYVSPREAKPSAGQSGWQGFSVPAVPVMHSGVQEGTACMGTHLFPKPIFLLDNSWSCVLQATGI